MMLNAASHRTGLNRRPLLVKKWSVERKSLSFLTLTRGNFSGKTRNAPKTDTQSVPEVSLALAHFGESEEPKHPSPAAPAARVAA